MKRRQPVRRKSPSMRKAGMGHKRMQKKRRVVLHGPNLRYRGKPLTKTKKR